jgi:histone H1/5
MATTAATKKAAKPKAKTPATHPSYVEMISSAISSLADKPGSSRIAIKKYIYGTYDIHESKGSSNFNINNALKRAVTKGVLKTNHYHAGLFKVVKPGKAKAAATDRPKTSKAAKKVVKKSTPKKTATKATVKKTPMKSSKKAAAKKTKKATPKKIKKPAAKVKKTPKKSAAVKKPAIKLAKIPSKSSKK